MKLLFILMALITLSACSTMNFVNGPEVGGNVERTQWHHIAVGGLVEISKPFDYSYYCDDKQWEKLTVELTFANLMAHTSAPQLPTLYSPWTIEYTCRESID